PYYGSAFRAQRAGREASPRKTSQLKRHAASHSEEISHCYCCNYRVFFLQNYFCRSTMNISVFVACAALLPIGFALVYLFRTLYLQPESGAALDQCLVLSIEKYRPMERLLREDDLRFLSAQSGFSAALGRRFRRDRRRIFRGY